MRSRVAISALVMAASVGLWAQAPPSRPLSGRGTASVQVGGEWVKTERGQRYEGGKWIDVTYGRPLLRQRTGIFGAGAEYGKSLLAGAPVWRMGADVSTRLKTDVALIIAGTTVAAGEYSLYAELKEGAWTLIVSSWPAQQKFDRNDKTALWGAYNYTPDKDVVRAPMAVGSLPFAVEEMTIGFVDVTKSGGKLAVMWEKSVATVPFTVAGT